MTTKTWGKYIWYFFHILAEKVTEEGYIILKTEICEIIESICNHLPCIICTEHASKYIKYTLNSQNLNTKNKLKDYLFKFHNDVNTRLNKEQFTDFDIYKKGNLNVSINYFKIVYLKSYDPYRGFIETLTRKFIIQRIDKLLLNKQYFNM